jgi:hypothetical protein
MPFNIPEENIAAITVLKAMPNASVDAFITAIKSAPLTADTDEIAKRIAERVPSIPPKQLEDVLDTLYHIYYIRELSGVPRPTFLKDFMDGLQDSPLRAADKKEDQALRAKFEKLLNIDTFNLLSKAKRLQRDGERLYCDAKIISDIRPVFGAKPTTRPNGAVVTHTLKLGYHEGGEHKEFHIILDCIDLEGLSDVIGRAQAKDRTLRDLLKSTRLPVLGV